MSSIRVFVDWKENTVFSGEDIECTITFKNVLPVQTTGAGQSRRTSKHNGQPLPPSSSRLTPRALSSRPPLSRSSSIRSQGPQQYAKGHKPALSLNTPAFGTPDLSRAPSNASQTAPQRAHSHGRSLSIISIGADGGEGDNGNNKQAFVPPRRLGRGHGRSASLQIVPGSTIGSPRAMYSSSRSTTHPSPLMNSSSPPGMHASPQSFTFPSRPGHVRRSSGRAATAPNTPHLSSLARRQSPNMPQDFSFPPKAPSPDPSVTSENMASPKVTPPTRRSHSHSPRPPEHSSLATIQDTVSPVARILSGTSIEGTPRSSGDFYMNSNHSDETLASEYAAQPSARFLPRNIGHVRGGSHLTVPGQTRAPETLMMGYAKISGSFTLDGSLVNQAPFEEVKRKGVVGGQGGGGVVGVERSKRDSGLFGSLGWSSFGQSLGEILGTAEPSSMREMKHIASSKTVPLLSTPQSILFVDLKLAPGESRKYKYTFKLPKGLPPSHKGRAMKVSYQLVVGTQRPGSSASQQAMRQVEIPFRVLSSVNARGDTMGHDLMSPYIILRDTATTSEIDPPTNGSTTARKPGPDDAGLENFLFYVDNLLSDPRQNSSSGLLSPTEAYPSNRRASSFAIEEPASCKEAIDMAILRSNMTSGRISQSANRFTIARSGRRVAIINFQRPAFRLGETIYLTIDFKGSVIPCYAMSVTLESVERVDPAIALRSAASIQRATKKVHARFAESTLWARRLAFSPTIPANGTPEFITSGVNHEWLLRFEFVTPRLSRLQQQNEKPDDVEDEDEDAEVTTPRQKVVDERIVPWLMLMEEVAADDRGVILAAAERLPCESFEVAVPIRVYGAPSGNLEGSGGEEGLVV